MVVGSYTTTLLTTKLIRPEIKVMSFYKRQGARKAARYEKLFESLAIERIQNTRDLVLGITQRLPKKNIEKRV